MKRTKRVVACCVSTLFLAAMPLAAETLHEVRKGDTLWGLSESYLKDPLLWPKIWKVNPEIHNPHLISPGQIVKIPEPEGEGSPMTPPASAGAALDLPSPPPAPLQPEIDRNAPPLSLKVVREEAVQGVRANDGKGKKVVLDIRRPVGMVTFDLPQQGRVLDTGADWTAAGAGETIFVAAVDPGKGKRYGVYRDMGEVKHPIGWRTPSPGHLVAEIGVVEIVEREGARQLARVVRSFAETREGDLLGPVMEPIGELSVTPFTAPIKGAVVAVEEDRLVASPNDVVYLDVGASQGLAPGHLLRVQAGKDSEEHRSGAELVVVRVSRNTAAAVVAAHSSHDVRPGDLVLPAL